MFIRILFWNLSLERESVWYFGFSFYFMPGARVGFSKDDERAALTEAGERLLVPRHVIQIAQLADGEWGYLVRHHAFRRRSGLTDAASRAACICCLDFLYGADVALGRKTHSECSSCRCLSTDSLCTRCRRLREFCDRDVCVYCTFIKDADGGGDALLPELKTWILNLRQLYSRA